MDMTDLANPWHRTTQIQPPENQRILVSDGEVQVIAQYVDNHWIFDNHSMTDMVVSWWKELEDNPPAIMSGSVENA
jgi:hypothetical protein